MNEGSVAWGWRRRLWPLPMFQPHEPYHARTLFLYFNWCVVPDEMSSQMRWWSQRSDTLWCAPASTLMVSLEGLANVPRPILSRLLWVSGSITRRCLSYLLSNMRSHDTLAQNTLHCRPCSYFLLYVTLGCCPQSVLCPLLAPGGACLWDNHHFSL